MMNQTNLSEKLSQLQSLNMKFMMSGLQVGIPISFPIESNIVTPVTNFFILSIIQRSLSLSNGFHSLIKDNNYMAAAHLIRPYLDNYLRFYAICLVENPNDFTNKIMDGVAINKLKDRNNQLLQDFYLVQKASEQYVWIKELYNNTSGLIHLSHMHILPLLDSEKKQIRVGIEDAVTDDIKINSTEYMIKISNCILELLQKWIAITDDEDKLKNFWK